jgi:hypothetical protein
MNGTENRVKGVAEIGIAIHAFARFLGRGS